MTVPNQAVEVPTAAKWLGGLGLVPFVALALAGPFFDDTLRARAAFMLASYGATIVSFLGGIHWGLAIARAADDRGLWRRLLLSVVPPLAAWATLSLPTSACLVALALVMAAMLGVDIAATRVGDAPAWYPRLRWPLSSAAVVALLVGSLL